MLLPGIDTVGQRFVADRYCHHYLIGSGAAHPRLFPGVQETLRSLYDDGYLLAVATGKSRRGLERSLRDTGLLGVFHASRCADETCSKPDPQMLSEILEELQIPVEQSVMVGDTEFDMEMAQRATMDRVAVTYGAHDVEDLRRWEPCAYLNNFSELGAWLALCDQSFIPRSVPCL